MPRTRKAQGELPPITRELVLETAMRVVRTDGIDGLSVRRVAAELDVWPTTVYHHVGGTKDGLLALTLDAVAGDVELPDGGGRPWRDDLEELAWVLRRRVAAYPGIAAHLVTAPAPGPNGQRIMERVMGLLVERAGLATPAAYDAYQALTGYVLTHVRRAEAATVAGRMARYVELGVDDDLPLTARVARDVSPDDDERFAGGLRIVVAGIVELAPA